MPVRFRVSGFGFRILGFGFWFAPDSSGSQRSYRSEILTDRSSTVEKLRRVSMTGSSTYQRVCIRVLVSASHEPL